MSRQAFLLDPFIDGVAGNPQILGYFVDVQPPIGHFFHMLDLHLALTLNSDQIHLIRLFRVHASDRYQQYPTSQISAFL